MTIDAHAFWAWYPFGRRPWVWPLVVGAILLDLPHGAFFAAAAVEPGPRTFTDLARRSGVKRLIGAGIDLHTVIGFSGHCAPLMLGLPEGPRWASVASWASLRAMRAGVQASRVCESRPRPLGAESRGWLPPKMAGGLLGRRTSLEIRK